MSRKYVLNGACLQCTLGSTEGKLKVTSQNKIHAQGKTIATDRDVQVTPTFGSCNVSSPPPACVPDLQQWKTTSRKVGAGNKKFVMEDSITQCSKGGVITVREHTQKSGGAVPVRVQQLSETVPFTG